MAAASALVPEALTVRVLFFGKLRDVFGGEAAVDVPGDGCSLAELKRLIAERIDGGEQALAERGVRSAVDRELTLGDGWRVRPGQEVAFFSAFSGG